MRGMALRLETKPVKPRCVGLRQRFYAQLAHPSKPAIGIVRRVKNLQARPVGYSQAIEAQSMHGRRREGGAKDGTPKTVRAKTTATPSKTTGSLTWPSTRSDLIAKLYKVTSGLQSIYACFFEFSFYTGMRPGEAMALRWSEVDTLEARQGVPYQAVRQDQGKDEDEGAAGSFIERTSATGTRKSQTSYGGAL
jgi:integrase